MNNGTLNVGTTGGTISDWGGSGSSTTATLTNNAVATYNSGLRMGVLGSGGATNATISGGARLVSNGSLVTGGEAASNVTLNVTGGRVESDATITLQRNTNTTVSSAGVIEGQDVVLGSSLGTTSTTVTGANSLLKARGTLTAGRTGTSSLGISAGGKVESLGATIIGELVGSNGTVIVSGSDSRLDVGSSLTIGGSGTGILEIHPGGFVPVTGGVSVGISGSLDLTGGALETSVGQSIANNGLVRASGNSQIRADIVNAGTLNVFSASTTRDVTLQANSQTSVDSATFGSLTHQAGAYLNFAILSTSTFDNLAVTGAASLNGDIAVSFINAFNPSLGDQFQILTASSISGAPTFDFSAAPLGSGLSWLPIQLPTSLTLHVVPSSTPGDFDFDGDVDGRDFLLWQRNTSVGNLNDWQTNYGFGSLTAASTAVPEPGSLILLGIFMVAAPLHSRTVPVRK